VEIPAPGALLERIRSLPAAPPLLARLGDLAGVHLVGGAVRDLLLGGTPSDLDLVVEGDVSAAVERLGGEVRRHDRFGTATVSVAGYLYDLACARRERYPAPGALPEVEPATLTDDLRRRDFTVNALAIELGGVGAGTLNAVPGALDDLSEGTLRVLHDASFVEDPTRMLRLVRYRTRLAFEPEPHTLELARAAVEGGALGTVSGPRIGAELRLLAGEPDPVRAVAGLGALGLDHTLCEGFGLGADDAAVAERALRLLPEDGDRSAVVLAAASRPVEAPRLAGWLDSLEFESGPREAIVAAATRSGALAAELGRAGTPSEIAAAVGAGAPELVALAGALGERAERAAREWLERLRRVELEIDGSDLIAAGIAEGPAIGRGLAAALAAKLDGRAAGRDAELVVALGAAR
jgi:tRNA nucleotidyltransferase (CCA-adding enzyme)